MNEYKIIHLFCGLGGAAYGMQKSRQEYKGLVGRFKTIVGIDCDPEACEDFEMITGAPAVQMDLFSEEDYILFHGKRPPPKWREITARDLFNAGGKEYPDVVFLSPPCKGFSGLLSYAKSTSEKYQALNRLVIRGLRLTLDAYGESLPAVIMLENVPRITSRGTALLKEIKILLAQYGYVFHEATHDCGELGGLGQRRKRYLLIARLPEKMSSFIYKPRIRKLKSIGDVIGPLPIPEDPSMGRLHRLPRLQWKTWVRLALIPAGGDWRDLQNCDDKFRISHIPRSNSFGIQAWDKTADTVIGNARIGGSTSSAIADPRLSARESRHPAVYQILEWNNPCSCVTGSRFGSGAPGISDPRTGLKEGTHQAIYQMNAWDEAANTVTGAMRPNNGAISITDPRVNEARLGCNPRSGTMEVQEWEKPSKTVTSADIHSGSAAVADPRIPKDNERPDPVPIIISLDGTWHRPITTLELAALQTIPLILENGSPLKLAGNSDARWRERIGNAVPCDTAEVIGEEILFSFLASELKDDFLLTSAGIWVETEIAKRSEEYWNI